MKLSNEQKKAGFYEFAIGVPLNIGLFAMLYYWILPEYPGLDSEAARVVFALKCGALPVANIMIAIGAVALGRGTTRAIDPLAGAESRTLQIHIRFLQNTLEQAVIFVLASASLAAFLDGTTIRVVPAAAVLFFVNRFLFWFGYLKDPMLRGLGLSGTLYPILIMSGAALYNALAMIFQG